MNALTTVIVPEEYRDLPSDPPCQLKAKAEVREWAKKDQRKFSAVSIFNQVLDKSGMADEHLCNAQRFCRLFDHEKNKLSPGVLDGDFVARCVERAFSISQIVEFGPKGDRQYWVSPSQIEEIVKNLVYAGFKLEPDL